MAEEKSTAVPLTAFQLSRVYAKGWRVGMNHPIDDGPIAIDALAELLSPCRVLVERARWMQGFAEAVRSRLARPGRRRPHFKSALDR